MRSLPLISFTCSTPSYSADILVILSSFGVLPVTFIALPKLPHMDLEPQGMLPIAGQKFGPSFFDLLLADCCSTAFGPWDPLSHLRLILDSLNFVKFECRAQGKRHFGVVFVMLPLVLIFNVFRSGIARLLLLLL